MKKIMIVACITLLGAMGAQAKGKKNNDHERKSAEERAKHKTEMLRDSLNLTADQEAKVLDINMEAEKKIDAAREANKDDKAKMREEIKAINMDRREKIKALLTPEQQEKLKKIKNDKHKDTKHGEHKKMQNQKK